MLNNKISDYEYVIFDLETTGLECNKEQIIEIYAQKLDSSGNYISEFHKFISLYKVEEVSDFISNLTNISNEMLVHKGENHADVMEEFFAFSKGCILVAQNIKFDLSFLSYYSLEHLDAPYSQFGFDVIGFAKQDFPGLSSYKLSELVKLYEIEYDENAHHRADYDVKITVEIFKKQLTNLNINKLTIKEGLTTNGFVQFSDKQASFLESLMGKRGHNITKYDVFSKNSASVHIDYYLNGK